MIPVLPPEKNNRRGKSVSNIEKQFTAQYRRNYVTFLAVALFFLIIAGEIFLATSIPILMRNDKLMNEHAARNELLRSFDSVRSSCNNITGKNSKGVEEPIILMEKKLVVRAVESLTRYMRSYGEHLNPDEVKTIQNLLNKLAKITHRLASGKSFSMENQLNTAEYINSLLKQSSPGYSNPR